MPLINQNGGGEFTSNIRWMGSTSSWKKSVDNYVEGATNAPEDFQFNQPAIIDLENLKLGWCYFPPQAAPEWVMYPDINTPVALPQDGKEWKLGFKVNLFSRALFGEKYPVREFGTSATGAYKGIQELYAQYEQQAPANVGKVPVVQFEGGQSITVGKGRTSVPKFTIVKWVDRPVELQAQEQAQVQQPAQAPVAPTVQVQQAPTGGISEF